MSVKQMKDISVHTDLRDSDFGIYAYVDTKTDQYIYIGKDSNIGKRKRHNRHMDPKYVKEQALHRLIQSDPARYRFKVIALCYDQEDLDNTEAAWIDLLHFYGQGQMNKTIESGRDLCTCGKNT